jgi:hypothetical protein
VFKVLGYKMTDTKCSPGLWYAIPTRHRLGTASETHDLLDCDCDCSHDTRYNNTDFNQAAGGGGLGASGDHSDNSFSVPTAKRAGGGSKKRKGKDMAALMSWDHLANAATLSDGLLPGVTPASAISFVLHKQDGKEELKEEELAPQNERGVTDSGDSGGGSSGSSSAATIDPLDLSDSDSEYE